MKVAVTGATGTIGLAVVRALADRGDQVVALTRDPGAAARRLPAGAEAVCWSAPKEEPAPPEALSGCDAAIHLLGESVAQRCTDGARREIRDSRVLGTRMLVDGLRAADPRPGVLLGGSASGYYGARGDEEVDESSPPGDDFLARVVVEWEAEARRAAELGLRVAMARTGVVLSSSGGALEKMLPPFKLGVGGPVAGGRQYVPWVDLDDVAGAVLFCLDRPDASGPINVCAPEPVTNRRLAQELGAVLGRPAVLPVPAFPLRLLYGDMASIVTAGVRAVPRRLQELGYAFRRPELRASLRAATGGD
ncbi:MAG: TIGR01777 family oxidoreductase [Actinobacteria bacterium]|nr:TIGR01777 family oxidoreductase [Actinomycetota bacterium]